MPNFLIFFSKNTMRMEQLEDEKPGGGVGSGG